MPEDDKQNLVDIDTSGPGAEVELEEEKVKEVKEVKEETTNEQDKTYENEREVKLEEKKKNQKLKKKKKNQK